MMYGGLYGKINVMSTFLGDEKQTWSGDDDTDIDTEERAEKSESTREGSTYPDVISTEAKDGYSSGDLGDVSQYYATEVPDERESDFDPEPPRKSFKERYAVASNDDDKSSSLLDQVVIPDKSGAGADLAMDISDAENQGTELINEEPPPPDETENLPSEELVDRILQAMWGYCHAYHISNSVSLLTYLTLLHSS